jgi:hypothetical protein
MDEWITRNITPFTTARVRYLSKSDQVSAKKWLTGKTEVKEIKG